MKSSGWIILLFCFACSSGPKVPVVHISLVNNNRSVKFSGLDGAILGEIGRDSAQATWQYLIPVFRMPADTDLKNYQHAQPGIYQLKDSIVVFTPDTPFTPGKTYFLRYYQFGRGQSALDLIKGTSKPGTIHHVDLVFKQ
ncbi:hypothetical protein [Mucilaginibacter sp.]|uniref:hypothetical protein n=1 Tax=Mucilaginibacter sp. TaxID=1882438 RepID=UPI003D0E091B